MVLLLNRLYCQNSEPTSFSARITGGEGTRGPAPFVVYNRPLEIMRQMELEVPCLDPIIAFIILTSVHNEIYRLTERANLCLKLWIARCNRDIRKPHHYHLITYTDRCLPCLGPLVVIQFIRLLTSLSLFICRNFFSRSTIHSAARNMRTPWPASPNMSEKRNGKLIMANGAENNVQASSWHWQPSLSTISWACGRWTTGSARNYSTKRNGNHRDRY